MKTHRHLSQEELDALAESRKECLSRLELTQDRSPEAILSSLEDSLKIANENQSNYSHDWIMDVSIMVGSVWGGLLEEYLGWHWIFIEGDPEGANGYALASPAEDYAIHPMGYAIEAIHTAPILTLLLSFNMLKAQTIPAGEVGTLENLMPAFLT